MGGQQLELVFLLLLIENGSAQLDRKRVGELQKTDYIRTWHLPGTV